MGKGPEASVDGKQDRHGDLGGGGGVTTTEAMFDFQLPKIGRTIVSEANFSYFSNTVGRSIWILS
jgi:hypothetical protein